MMPISLQQKQRKRKSQREGKDTATKKFIERNVKEMKGLMLYSAAEERTKLFIIIANYSNYVLI